MTDRYQFCVHGKPAAPVRDTINEAAFDALEAGFCTPDEQNRLVLHDDAEIAVLGPVRQIH